MTIGLQILLATIAILTAVMIILNIRKSRIQIEDSFFWLVFAIVLLFMSIFPYLFIYISDVLGFTSPSNFVILFIIFLLIVNQYHLTKKLSLVEIKLKKMIQYIALVEKEQEDKKVTKS
ncbi:DUF2304 domain-containing protein [Streptococcus dysgalactiae subsp. dysgalactiae]|uniref:DUF2304 domain-containing protein n=3 Tax=Streptococcus dysgalactiae TaxID=1334 RepID=A0AAE9QTS7_STREQ|nr:MULTISPECIES: DUF2304 domain-containing protein [Streptococcus]ADX24325.1 membrane protein [Streptococcus dysgalactiae subsp. equisimilis ATCC 12394]MBM6513090.1 DUF2304 domain-containing protein [Streptococcus dysgalactiae subsp. equisimilis]MBM6533197.1 DUF2304 domain-containing protein [Streptococcus dysgalactiae subsp. equisimilis]MBM6547943.1 DUF2304 domain-containing protein [Streptococcus dysgalactiae subsp. equisimilis]MCY7208271.1 DUF2304 domain-containing protein [Streptococcus dy